MKKYLYKQAGFSSVEVLLTILILVVIAFAGYYVYHTQHPVVTTGNAPTKTTSKPTSTAVSDVTANTGSAHYDPSTSPSSAAPSFIAVDEWGIKLPTISVANPALRLPLNYEEDVSAPDDSVISIRVFQGTSSACSDGTTTVPLVYMYHDQESSDYSSADYTFSLGGHTYYLYKDGASKACTGNSASVDQDEVILINQIKQAQLN